MRTILYGAIGVAVAVAFLLGLGGCGGVSTSQALIARDSGAQGGDAKAPSGDHEASAPDVVGMEEVGGNGEAHDGGAGTAGGDDAIDAVTADADGGNGVNPEVAQEAPAREVAAPDIISGDWVIVFINKQHGQMTLTLVGTVVSGTYNCGLTSGPGTVVGTYDGALLTLNFAGSFAAMYSGGPGEIQGDGTRLIDNAPATLNGMPAVFWARH